MLGLWTKLDVLFSVPLYIRRVLKQIPDIFELEILGNKNKP